MRRTIQLTAIISLFLFAFALPCFSQSANPPKNAPSKEESLPTADEIAAKCAKGSGGKEAWAKLSTQVLSGTMEITNTPIAGKLEITSKAPNKVFHLFSIGDGQFVQKRGFDGRVGWEFDSQKGFKRLEGAELEDARLEGIFDTDVRLREIYPDMRVTGRSKVGERNAYTVLIHESGSRTKTVYFDAETGLRIAEDSESPDATGKPEKTKVLFEEYRGVSGIQIPFLIHVTAPAFELVIRIQDVKHNVPVDDALFAMPAAGNSPAESKPNSDSTELDTGTFTKDVYINRFLGIRYQAPAGWSPHGEETKKEIMAVGKSLVDQKTPGGKAIADRAEERAHQLLTLFQYPLGTPDVENQLVQILAEDIRFAPGIKSGKEYLLNVQQVLKTMKTMPEFDKEPREVTYSGRIMHRMDIATKMPTKTIYQSMVAVVLKGYAVSFAFTSFSPEGRENLLKTLDTLRIDNAEENAKPH